MGHTWRAATGDDEQDRFTVAPLQRNREYIKEPKTKIPGTKMAYAGLKDEQKTNDLIAFLQQFDADGKKK